MHDRLAEPYPRRVVVPEILTGVGCPVALRDAGAGARSAAAAETVRWMGGSMRHLPAELLDVALPEPGVMFRGWSLGARTRGAVARLGAPGCARALCVRDLLGAARVGPAALVDLLAALEENEVSVRPPERTGAPATPIERIAALITSRLPFASDALGAMLAAEGLATEALDVDAVARLFSDWEAALPFRVVRRGGATVLVAPTSLASADALISAASHAVQQWGLCRVTAVLERVRSFGAIDLDERGAARVLATMPGFRWLDERSGWFSLGGASGRVGTAIGKLFAVADAVPVDELGEALQQRVGVLGKPPRLVLERYLVEVLGCELRGGVVTPGPSFVGAELARGERLIVDILLRHDGALPRAALRAVARSEGVAPTTLRQLLRDSPLVVATADTVRLAGHRFAAAARIAA
jgi:hypothetical protein